MGVSEEYFIVIIRKQLPSRVVNIYHSLKEVDKSSKACSELVELY